jgi:hypothetical protein
VLPDGEGLVELELDPPEGVAEEEAPGVDDELLEEFDGGTLIVVLLEDDGDGVWFVAGAGFGLLLGALTITGDGDDVVCDELNA